MIVTDDDVHTALTYLAGGGAAEAEAAFLAAERARERRGAEVFLGAAGSVDARKMRMILDNEYQSFLEDENQAKAALTKAKSMERHADKVCEIWRTINANARAAERVR